MSLVWVDVGAGRQRLVETNQRHTTDSSAPYVRPDRLTAKARRALAIQLGVSFDSESALRRHMKDNGLRFVDRGEKVDKVRRSREEWIAGTEPGKRGKAPHVRSTGYAHYGD